MQRITIIEDNETLAALYEFKLNLEGFETTRARDGKEGLLLTESFRPDLILLDLLMPVMSGDEMLEKMRATRWGSSIRVIILTNISKDESPSALRLLNVDRYIVKAHYTPSQVVSIVHEVLGT